MQRRLMAMQSRQPRTGALVRHDARSIPTPLYTSQDDGNDDNDVDDEDYGEEDEEEDDMPLDPLKVMMCIYDECFTDLVCADVDEDEDTEDEDDAADEDAEEGTGPRCAFRLPGNHSTVKSWLMCRASKTVIFLKKI